MQKKPTRVCYLNIVGSDFSRSGVHMRALQLKGVQILSCIDTSPGARKFWELYKKHRALKEEYDVVIVGYPAYILVPFARFVSRKPVLFDAGWSLYEGTVIARGLYAHNPLRRFYYWFLDWIACRSATLVLLESNCQIDYYTRLLRTNSSKCRRLFTGVDESQFYADPICKKRTAFTVVFRGYSNPEAGLSQILEVARALEDDEVQFLIISPNFKPEERLPANVELRHGFFDIGIVRGWMQECHVSLGQMSTNERLERTIPHKAFESMLLQIPFMTSDVAGVRELFDDKSAVLVQRGSEINMVEQLKRLKGDPDRCARIAENALKTYTEKCSNAVLAEELMGYIRSVLK